MHIFAHVLYRIILQQIRVNYQWVRRSIFVSRSTCRIQRKRNPVKSILFLPWSARRRSKRHRSCGLRAWLCVRGGSRFRKFSSDQNHMNRKAQVELSSLGF